MIVAVDTSALAKLLVEEAESVGVREYFIQRSSRGDEFAISAVAITELRRLAIRADIDPARVDPVITPFRIIRLTDGMLQLAGRLPYRHLGTLDALHLATALDIEAAVFITFDQRQAEAATAEGLSVQAPGR